MRKPCEPMSSSPIRDASPRELRSSAADCTLAESLLQSSKDKHSQVLLRKDTPSRSTHTAASQDLVDVWQARGRKRRCDSGDQQSNKRRQESVTKSQLSRHNLRKLEIYLEELESGPLDEMDPDCAVRIRKRALSRQASLSDLNPDTASLRSQNSSISNSFYRYRILKQAKIYVCPEPPPTDIQAQMDIIFKREILEERRRRISSIAKGISQQFINKLRGSHREDDLVEIIYEALHLMHPDETFEFSRKAGIVLIVALLYMSLRANTEIDWDPSLKPNGQQKAWDLDALDQPNKEADDVVSRLNERQQGERSFHSPDTSLSTMPAPVAPSRSKQVVKTPRPDFTIGLHHSTMSEALMKRGLSESMADGFLEDLQCEGKLYSDPTQDFLNVRFPILVIEGKAYATGRTAFEAQNQAAVSGACMVNLLRQLTDLYEGVYSNSGGKLTHLAFSICSEGPQIEFWVHYSLLKDKVRNHYMNIFRTCHGSLQDRLEDFLMDVERLMRWTEEDFLEEVADQVFKLANHTARE
ncbi:hypothetical protein MMC09_004149 [Bachmanniomyces sp. S44760]|nr:hypothetical protein [Bachmanniomyces sp. S44760]